ncbi:Thyrostimulin alpha-2 subunit [Eumeta japonica]|uniref:Thyrostimulin alpha-2 subunit n=1 Tax=Eumeta variegata TaxID=151549 RepID=A0A4C1UA74_EUMVA|nr:Thyrostimulin alpha-2 subunit [Eumeta japonica]
MMIIGLLLVLSLGQIFAVEEWKRAGCHLTGYTRNISIPDCVSFRITTNACRGYCESWSLPSIMLGFKRHPVTSLGQCCNIMESEDQDTPRPLVRLDEIRLDPSAPKQLT